MYIWIKVFAQKDLRIQLGGLRDTLSNCQRKQIQGTNEADEGNLEDSIRIFWNVKNQFWAFKDF